MIPLSWLIGGVSAAALIFATAGYFSGYSKGHGEMARKCDARIADIQTAANAKFEEMQDDINDASVAYESARSEQAARRSVTVNTIREIYKDVEVPASCEPPTVAVGVLNTEISRANAAASGKPGE